MNVPTMKRRTVLCLMLLSLGCTVIAGAQTVAPQAQPVTGTPATVSPPSPVPAVSLGHVLTALDPYGKAFKEADTTAKKDQVRQQARAALTNLIQGKTVVVRSVISDASIPKPGVARITFGSTDLRPFDPTKPHFLFFSSSGTLVAPQPDADTLALSKGQILELTGTASIARSPSIPMGAATFTRSPQVLAVMLLGDMSYLGVVHLDSATWRVIPSVPKR